MNASLPVPRKAKPVRDPADLVLQILGLCWIPMKVCRPPMHLEFFALTVKGPGDYLFDHCVYDGTGNEGLENVTHWFPAPRIPKRAVEGFPPHQDELGQELERSLLKWLKAERG